MERNCIFDDLRTNPSCEISFGSGIGSRPSQQDTAYIAASNDDVLAVVCDGMGGVAGGQAASRTAVEAFVEFYQTYAQEDPSGATWMRTAAEAIDDIVYLLSDSNRQRLGAGTTLISVIIHDSLIHWLSVGDSRIYLIRGNEIAQVTTDHNYLLTLNQQKMAGQISPEQYHEEARSGDALISFIGMGGLMMMDINDIPFQLLPGDVVLLCTDGLYRTVSDYEIRTIISESQSMEQAAGYLEKLIEQRALPYQDNYTFVLIKKIRGNAYE